MDDRTAIAALVNRCAAAVAAGDGDRWAACWRDDASWNLIGQQLEGILAVRQTWEQALDLLGPVVQSVHTGTVELDGDTATGQWLVSERVATGNVMLGLYDDAYTRSDDAWRFQRRTFTLLGEGPAVAAHLEPEIVLVGRATLAPEARDEVLAAAVAPMQSARASSGCLAYVFAADPVEPDTISIHEHWRDAASLDAHLAGPNYSAMLSTLAQGGLTGVWVDKHEIRRSAPVYNSDGQATASFEGV